MEKITKIERKEKGEEKLWAGKLVDLGEVEKDELISRLLSRLKEVEEICEALSARVRELEEVNFRAPLKISF